MNQPISTHPESRTPACAPRSRPWPLPAHLQRVRWLCGLLGILLLLSMAAGMARAQSERPLAGPSISWNGKTYAWVSGGDLDPYTSELRLVYADSYYCSSAGLGITVSVDENSITRITDDSTGGVIGVAHGGTAHLNSSGGTSISGINSRNLFHDTYTITSTVYSIYWSAGMGYCLGVTEIYQAVSGSGGQMTVSFRYVDYAIVRDVVGNDPVVGDFKGSFNQDGEFIFDKDRSAPTFVPTNSLWLNSTLLKWKASEFRNSAGAVSDTYDGTIDGHAVTVEILGDVPLFRSTGEDHVAPIVTIRVPNGSGDFVAEATGSYVTGEDSTAYFSVAGWYVGVAEFSRLQPLWATDTWNLWWNGSTRYGFRGGIDDGAGTSHDIYVNNSTGKIVVSGNTLNASLPVTADVTYNGDQFAGTFDGSAFCFLLDNSLGTSGGDGAGIWVNGHLYMRSDGSGDTYTDTAPPFRTVIAARIEERMIIQGNHGISGFSGSCDAGAGGVFYCISSVFPNRPLLACLVDRGRLFQTGSSDLPGMPIAVKVDGKIWTGAGSGSFTDEHDGLVHQCSYYGNAADAPSSLLRISETGRVTLLNFIAGTSKEGTYSSVTGLFQTAPESAVSNSLPMPMYRTTGPNGGNVRDWALPPTGRPATVAVDGHVWGFVASTDGNVHYAGEYYGQELIIRPPNGRNGTSQVSLQVGLVLGVPVGYSGTFYKGGFTMNGGSPPVTAGDGDGALVNPTDGLGRYQNVVADLDITGNILTLGSWAGDPTLSHAGMALQYSEAFTLPGKALIYMTGSREDTSFLWNHATPNSASNAPMMLLAGADHSLRLFAPSDPANAAITLNPSGQSYLLNFGPYPDTANDTATGTNKTKGILVIGAGSKVGATVTPRNAMRITDDGVVLIRESGDIPMGEFANGPRP